MKSKRAIHRKSKKTGNGKSRNNAAQTPVVKEDTIDKCTKYMRFFYWSYRVVQIFTGNSSDLIGKGLLLLIIKEAFKALFNVDIN